MAAVSLRVSEESARVLDFCRKFLQLRGMRFMRADVCGALVDVDLDMEAVNRTRRNLGRSL